MPKPWQTYIDDVLSGERIAGRLERLAVERFCRLCEKPEYYFDEEEADYIINLLSHFRHTKGKYYGKQWQLLPWQAFFFAYIFGLKYKSSGLRVVRKVLLCMAKKGGKSEVGGALGAIMSFFDDEQGAECYSAANKYDQAKFCWDAAKVMLKQLAEENDFVGSNLKIYDSITTRQVLNLGAASFFKPIAADAKTLDGVNPHLGIVDEYHEAADDSIPNNLESGMVAREQPLIAIVTTRGFNSNGVLRQLEKAYIDILEGKLENDSVFPLIFSLDEGDDWQDEAVWPKANPGIGITPTWEGLREQYQKAVTEGATAEVNFKTKNMNIWTNVAETWIQHNVWMRGATEYTIDDLIGRDCYGGLDLAQNRDIAAASFVFPPEYIGDKYRQITKYYCPEETIATRSRQDRVPYLQWVADGFLTATPGNVIDFDYIEEDIREIAEKVNLRLLYYDPYNAAKVVPNLVLAGIECQSFAQTPGNYTNPIKYLDRIANGRNWQKLPGKDSRFPVVGRVDHKSELPKDDDEVNHLDCYRVGDEYYIRLDAMMDQGIDPIMPWMVGNAVLFTSRHGNLMFDKSKAREKIDGLVSYTMGIGAYLTGKEDDSSVYEGREIVMF